MTHSKIVEVRPGDYQWNFHGLNRRRKPIRAFAQTAKEAGSDGEWEYPLSELDRVGIWLAARFIMPNDVLVSRGKTEDTIWATVFVFPADAGEIIDQFISKWVTT